MFDKVKTQEINSDVIDALQAVAEKHGVDIKFGGSTYGETITTKIKIVEQGDSVYAAEWRRGATFLGFEENHLGREFKVQGKYYKIEGLKPRARKNVVVVSNGSKLYRMDDEVVLRHL